MAFAPDLRTFSSGQNFAAWLGLVPRQHTTGGKIRLCGVSKMGQNDIRRLLIVGAMSKIRWIVRKGLLPDNWLGRLLGRKPRMGADDKGAELQDGVIRCLPERAKRRATGAAKPRQGDRLINDAARTSMSVYKPIKPNTRYWEH